MGDKQARAIAAATTRPAYEGPEPDGYGPSVSMPNPQRHTFYGWVRVLSSHASGRGGHPRSVGGAQHRSVVTRTGGRPLAECEPAFVACRSVSRLDRPSVSGHFLLALPNPAVEQIQYVSEALACELGVVAVALVAAERVLAVHLQP